MEQTKAARCQCPRVTFNWRGGAGREISQPPHLLLKQFEDSLPNVLKDGVPLDDSGGLLITTTCVNTSLRSLRPHPFTSKETETTTVILTE
jgi:hypothetical protein